ncbi:MAG: hypothetical protein KIH65_000685 [Candidatus Uhrbacteria bacterium]|nr:hypothetical protein [Candidatus Uhrbacteria bacterium]
MKNKRSASLLVLTSLTLVLSQGCGDLDLSGIGVQLPGQDVTAQWQSPASYSRTPTGTNPVNPITLSVDFSDQSGCPNKTYRFWLFSKDGGTPLTGIGSNAELLPTNHFEQVVSLPIDVPVYQIRLACTKANGERYANSDILESGSPAFTPRSAVSWQNPEGYSRLPAGTTPTNPITLSVDFSDQNGCPYQLYRFWAYALDGSPVGPIGSIMTLTPGSGVTTSATLPVNVPIHAVRLACVDNEGNQYEDTANLEVGNPAFTPTSSGTCSGHNATLCAAPTTSSTCTTCGGTWAAIPPTTNICSGEPTAGGATVCAQENNQSDCENLGLLDGNGPCTWNGSTCDIKSTVCSSTITEINCDALINGGMGDCTWGPDPMDGTCTGESTNLGETTCAQLSDESTCTHQGVLDGSGKQVLASSYCTWNGSACHIKSTVCSDLNNQIRCNMLTSNGYGNCTWNAASTCNNPTATLCTSPQTQETCTTCGGTWTTP